MGIRARLRRWAASSAAIAVWATDDVAIPRWLLTVKYGFLTLLGVVVIFASQPTIEELTDSAAWTTGWGYGVAAFAAACFVGSLSPRKAYERVERIASVGLMSLFIIYALAPLVLVVTRADLGRASLSVVALALTTVPFARMLRLLRSTGTTPAPPEEPPHG
jgi:hypothetical protein